MPVDIKVNEERPIRRAIFQASPQSSKLFADRRSSCSVSGGTEGRSAYDWPAGELRGVADKQRQDCTSR